MRYLILLFIFLFGLLANAQIVNIPDANFKAALLSHYPAIDFNNDGEIQVHEANNYTNTISVYEKNISDLKGIEDFTSITNLRCDGNNLTNIDISNNTELIYFNCLYNNLNSLDVSNNTALQMLYCGSNKISNIDVSNNTELKEILIFNNNLSSLDVSNNTALLSLGCGWNNIRNLDVSNNIVLGHLECGLNGLSNLDLSNNVSLAYLECNNNSIDSLDLRSNILLFQLECEANDLIFLNVKNGNNTNLRFSARHNPDLYCIEVDDSKWSTDNWYEIDSHSYFNEDCASFVPEPTSIVHFVPNPFIWDLKILFSGNVNLIEISIYNMLGWKIEVPYEKISNEITIKGESLMSGIYIIEFKEQDRLLGNVKIVKQ